MFFHSQELRPWVPAQLFPKMKEALLQGGSSSPRGLLISKALWAHLWPMQSTQQVTVAISIIGNILTFIDI